MINVAVKDVLKACITGGILFYGTCYMLTDMIYNILPCGIILIIILAASIYFLRIPPPNINDVETIIGKDPFNNENNNGNYIMRTVAHRGAGLDAPENTLTAFNMCKEKGCDAIEFDVVLTKDNVPIVFHDKTLERMTDSTINIKETDWEQLKYVNLSVKHALRERYSKTYIPTLEQTIIQLLANGQKMFIDIKDNDVTLVKIIHLMYEKYPELYSKAIVTTFYPYLIYLIRRGNPKIVCSIGWRPYTFAYDSYNYPIGKGIKRAKTFYHHLYLNTLDTLHEWALNKFIYYILGLSIVLLHKDAINARSILEWRKKGVRVIAWTVNSPAEKQYLARYLKITYLTDTLVGETTTHSPPTN